MEALGAPNPVPDPAVLPKPVVAGLFPNNDPPVVLEVALLPSENPDVPVAVAAGLAPNPNPPPEDVELVLEPNNPPPPVLLLFPNIMHRDIYMRVC